MCRHKGSEITGHRRELHTEIIIYALHELLLSDCQSKLGRHGTGECTAELWSEILQERDHLRDPGVDGMVILKRILHKYGNNVDCYHEAQGRVQLEAACGGSNEPSGFHEKREISWLTERT
jgi:hypothetical protein